MAEPVVIGLDHFIALGIAIVAVIVALSES